MAEGSERSRSQCRLRGGILSGCQVKSQGVFVASLYTVSER